MATREDQARLDAAVKAINDALENAIKISDETGIEFSIYPAYGMGGTYVPKPKKMTRSEALALIEAGTSLTSEQRDNIATILRGEETDDDESWDESGYGWQSSSASC